MLPGHEDITYDIEEDEIEIAKVIASGLKRRIGKKNAITGKQIIAAMKKNRNVKLDPIRLRKMITYIRVWNLVPLLCSGKVGYFVAETEEEWTTCLESLKKRARQQMFTVHCMEFFNNQQEKL